MDKRYQKKSEKLVCAILSTHILKYYVKYSP